MRTSGCKISFKAFLSESAVVESSMHQHFPYGGVALVICFLLGENFCPEIVVVASKTDWDSIIIRSGEVGMQIKFCLSFLNA
jgi:hypothetical protein